MRKTRNTFEPIAIVGMACRFPAANDIEAFWRLLETGGNAVAEGIPGSGVGRWGVLFGDEAVQSEGCRFGAFVDDIDRFDAAFFRISPVEARMLDPQQRMMLEVTWHALEDAGVDPERLRGSRTGVYTGISNDEYRMLVVDSAKPAKAASCLYALSGTNLNGTAGRVSFVLGLTGPAKAVDAACASAMVAINDAVADLQQSKTDLAIAGGVQTILNGRVYQLRADAMMLSPDGKCKTFDALANGYVRAEGCGVVILKRLSEAEADGDRIWAVIRGSAVNHGGTGVGLTVPNTPGLAQVMENALAQAGVDPLDVDYVEAHGTGTAVGDPIELNAVESVYGRGRDTRNPLLIGSVKTNVGHLESAAGVAGLIKAALVVKRGVIPKHLHFHTPNPAFQWDSASLKVTTSMTDWPDRTGRPRVVGVNCFGISGTNAHLLVAEYQGQDEATAAMSTPVGATVSVQVALLSAEVETGPRRSRLLPLSAKSEDGLRDVAARYLLWLNDRAGASSGVAMVQEALLADMAWTAGVGRSHFDHRAGVVFNDTKSLREGLKEWAEGARSVEAGAASTVAFAYTGQGSQWTGMGRVLYETEPVVQTVMDRCAAVCTELRGISLLDVMFGRGGDVATLGDTAWEQPALYALECALAALWESVGVRPDAVIGHSVGELAAARAAGVFSLEDGMRFACARGALMSEMEEGAMAAVFAPAARVAAAVEGLNVASNSPGVSISGDNGTHQVISGRVADVKAISAHFEARGVRVLQLDTAWAFHSALVDPILDDLYASLTGMKVFPPTVAMVSNLTGRTVRSDELLDGPYWRRHAREAVAFACGVGALADLGVDLVIEIGPRPVLGAMALAAWPEARENAAPAVVASMTRANDGTVPPGGGMVEAVALAYQAGLRIRFEGLFAGELRRRISLPSYPFQRSRHWLEAPRLRSRIGGHPLLGVRHESARGDITFETEIFPNDPSWLEDHRVFGRVVAPGALYGTMAVALSLAEVGGPLIIEDMQLHNALVFMDDGPGHGTGGEGRRMQAVLDAAESAAGRRFQIFSKGSSGEWTVHVEARLSPDAALPDPGKRIDPRCIRDGLSPVNVTGYYRAKASTGVDLGPYFRTLGRAWSGPGEAVAEISLPEGTGSDGLDVHPLVLDGCFQVVGAARNLARGHSSVTYLPFAWDRLWLTRGGLPDRVVCHVRLSEPSHEADTDAGEPSEVLSGEIRIYDRAGVPLGGINGYTVKRATRAALLSATEGVDDLLYEVVWCERALTPGMLSADFMPPPGAVKASAFLWSRYLVEAGVAPDGRIALLTDLERWSRSYAAATLDRLGWNRSAGAVVHAEELREELGVMAQHARLFRRMLEMLAKSGMLAERVDGAFVVVSGSEDSWNADMPDDPRAHAHVMEGRYSHGLIEIGLFRRSGDALADVLRGRVDPLTLLFSSGKPTAADLYLKAPVARAANRLLEVAVQTLIDTLPEGRRLRVIEIGAGTGSATASILPLLPEGRFDYTYTDLSAGFFTEAEARFGDGHGCIVYRPLDVEKDPIAQGFNAHGYDLIIASNVLHATRYLEETLGHCVALLAPSGQLVALENLTGLGWMDLTFGQLDGWWRFADDYRPHHALASPAVWRQALGDAGFEEVEVLGVDESDPDTTLDKGVIVARGPAGVAEAPGVCVLAADDGDQATELAEELAARNQRVVIVRNESLDGTWPAVGGAGVFTAAVRMEQRQSWRSLLESLPTDVPLKCVVHFVALEGHGEGTTADEMARDVRRVGASALAMVQGLADAAATPETGVWFITRGAQVLERERGGELVGAVLWGFGKGVAREAAHLRPRMVDLDPSQMAPGPDLVNEFLYPDREDHIAYRGSRRMAARLVRAESGPERLALPEGTNWVLAPDPGGKFDRPYVRLLPACPLKPHEVRVSVQAAALNFWDVFRSLGFIEEGLLGREMCGHVVETGSCVGSVAVGDHVVGMGFGAFGPEMVTHEELVALAPHGIPVTGLATIPSAFVSAALSFEYSGLKPGDRVLIHAGAGGVGMAAIQLAQAAGAEIYATASAPKQAYLRSLGVTHVYDSRTTAFGAAILEATDGEGVEFVLNSLTGEGFIDASLSCLKRGGQFVELARRDILTAEEMSMVRPDVAYHILELDILKKIDPESVGRVLRGVMAQVSSGEIKPIVHSRWPLAEAGAALSFMRSARHLGKIVVTTSPLQGGRLRQDRTYLVTGGLGGIGCAVADWLADQGARAIVLNGRRDPDDAALETIRSLRERGVPVQVELADVVDGDAVKQMLMRVNRDMPPLAGVIHSVGVLSDGALTNQDWERFERVLWPKVLGAWHLHRATMDLDLDLDMFVLFSSRVGVMGNPGQANHASANAFLDQLAGYRRAMGLAGQAIAWGAWSEIGEAAEQRERIDKRRSALGGRWFTPQQGIRALDRLVRRDATTSVVMSMDWSVFTDAVEERPPLLKEMLSAASEAGEDPTPSARDVLSRLCEAPAAEHVNVLVSFLQGEVQAVLRLQTAPAPGVGFVDLGMDSLMAVELRNRLNRTLAGTYTAPNTLVFDYPDIASLAAHLAGELAEVGETSAAVVRPEQALVPIPATREEDEGIAVIGIACRFPGSPDIDSFWQQLEVGADLITDGRTDGGLWSGVAGDPDSADNVSRRGAFLKDIDKFDARFFRIPPIEARMMDPRQRLLLETTWHALEDAGIDPDQLKGSCTGVYVGVGGGDYRDLAVACGAAHGYLGTAPSVTVGRVSFVLGLTGPAVPLDMACASSLVAVHQAVSALRDGEVDMAIVGGVHTVLAPGVTAFMSEVGMLSRKGRCYSFDDRADGFVRGEGCGVVILKPLDEARAAGDRIWGVIRGSAVNQNGPSAGLTVPNGLAQERVIEEALARAGITPAEVDYLEAHGTGSALGDPIEVQAAAAVYGRGRDPRRPLLIGSLKTNIGHLECAAGIASLVKVVLALNEEQIPRQLHFDKPNPHLDWERLPVRVTAEPTEWPTDSGRPKRAGVSAFGISGTNAHVVVEANGPVGETPRTACIRWPAGTALPVAVVLREQGDWLPPPTGFFAPRETRILPLSGKSPEAMRQLAERYLTWLDGHERNADAESAPTEAMLADMAWTAGTGRSHFEHRSPVLFDCVTSLRGGLRVVAGGDGKVHGPPNVEPSAAPRVAFIYAAEGSERVGMGQSLYDCEPVVRAVLDRCDAVLRKERAGVSLLDIMFGRTDAGRRLRDPEWAQPAMYSLGCALTALLESVGIQPAVVAGEGVGEFAAAWAAGVFSLEDGLRVAAARGAAMPRRKSRVAAGLLSGGPSRAEQEPIGALEAIFTRAKTSPPSRTLLFPSTGKTLESRREPSWAQWREHREQPCRGSCAGKLAELGVSLVVEVSAHGITGPMALSAWPQERELADQGFAESVAQAYRAGLQVSFAGLFSGEMRRRISIPGYPFQRKRHWIKTVA